MSYGMVAGERLFWLDAHQGDLEEGARMLCRRHADSMVVPIGWTLDDRRDPDLHLFKPPPKVVSDRRRTPRKVRDRDGGEQLKLDAEPSGETAVRDDTEEVADPEAWTPTFDTDSDLDGLLSATTPLLARAFRGDDRPRRT